MELIALFEGPAVTSTDGTLAIIYKGAIELSILLK